MNMGVKAMDQKLEPLRNYQTRWVALFPRDGNIMEMLNSRLIHALTYGTRVAADSMLDSEWEQLPGLDTKERRRCRTYRFALIYIYD